MHLVRPVLALMVALCLVAFSAPRPGASAGHAHAAMHQAGARHEAPAGQVADCHGRPPAADEGGGSCCGTMACHAVALAAVPALLPALRLLGTLAHGSAPQVAEARPARLDRPPRTV